MAEHAKKAAKPKPSTIPISSPAPAAQVHLSPDGSRVTATLPTGESVAVLLYGATVVSWRSGGAENLFVSDTALLDGSKAVRGGIPLVFPVFGPPGANLPVSKLPQHGFARTSRWEFLGKSTSESGAATASGGDDSVKLDFGLSPVNLAPEMRAAWPFDFSLIYSVTLGRDGRELETSMFVRNEGDVSFDVQLLFHSYFAVKDITQTTVAGLAAKTYADKVLKTAGNGETAEALAINGEVDRVYSGAGPITILEGGVPRLEICRDNLADVVVWNPGAEKAGGMKDLHEGGWRQMLCVEPGAVATWQTIEPQDTFEGGQIVKVLG
ncbi:MAG: hypothetical protein M1829_003640 [Trizodia sp. TS-e1964]|nr:MAG: hypothetical protein M1829_003640 [Trizodia sp. TS-e1964]